MAKDLENSQKILIVFDLSQSEDVDRVLEWLARGGYARVLEKQEGMISLQALTKIAADSALVFVSDCAISNPDWQRTVRQLESNVRLIPIGATENVNYADPEVVPPHVESINFIRQDEFMLENILDSLMTNPTFYSIKNSLRSQAEQWELSHRSDSFLLYRVKEIMRFLSMIRDKLKAETEPYFASQLEQIFQFLGASLQYSKKLRRKRFFKYLQRSLAAVAVIGMVFLIIEIKQYTNRIYYVSYSLANTDSTFMPELGAIKMMEILTNPLIDSQAIKSKAVSMLLANLDRPWEYTPTGNDYAWATNDFSISAKTDVIWTANGDGAITRWNRESGKIESHVIISDQPLDFLAVNHGESMFAAIDRNRSLLVKNLSVSDQWRRCAVKFDFQPRGVVASENGGAVAVVGDTDFCIVAAGETFDLLASFKFDKVFKVMASAETGFHAVVQDGSQVKFLEIDGGILVDSAVIPGRITSQPVYTSKVAISPGRQVAFIDNQQQLLLWRAEDPDLISQTGIICPKLTDIQFQNEQIVVFGDRNLGTHLVDIIQMIDLGQILSNAESVNSLEVFGNQVFGKTTADIHSQDVTDFLPLRSLSGFEVLGVFDSTESACLSGVVRRLRITSSNLIVADVLVNNQVVSFEITSQAGILFSGKPTVAGILPDGYTILVGSEDGSFQEISFSIDGTRVLTMTRKQLPSRSPVQKIFYLRDSYLILDADDLLWKSKMAATLKNMDDFIAAYKAKNHMRFAEDLLKSVSPDLVKKLGLELSPVRDGKAWEYKP